MIVDTESIAKMPIQIHGISINIENQKGSIRQGTAPDGTKWQTNFLFDYGYISNTEGRDNDCIDVFIGPNKNSMQAFVVYQNDISGKFDEHKVFLGFNYPEEVKVAYLAHYSQQGYKFLGQIKEMTIDQFKDFLQRRSTIDAEGHWVTIKKKPNSEKYRRILLNSQGKIIGGDLPKEAQGKIIGGEKESPDNSENKKAEEKSEAKSTSKEEKKEPLIIKKEEKRSEETPATQQKTEEKKEEFSVTSNTSSSKIREEFQKHHEVVRKELDDINSKIRSLEKDYVAFCGKLKAEDLAGYWKAMDSRPESREYRSKRNSLDRRHKELSKGIKDKLFDLLKTKSPSKTSARIISVDNGENKEAFKKWSEKTTDLLMSICDKNILQNSNVMREDKLYFGVGFRRGVRPYYEDNTIFLGNKDKKALFHEMGHFIEHNNRGVSKACQTFLKRRTEGKPTKRLYENSDEIYKDGGFVNSYVGKIYRGGETEILSVGLELLLKDPAKFIKKDPEHFDLVVDILRGKVK